MMAKPYSFSGATESGHSDSPLVAAGIQVITADIHVNLAVAADDMQVTCRWPLTVTAT